MTTKQLAQRLEVSERTILRDLEALSVSGVPVYSERGSQGGWRLAEGYRTKLTGIKPEELAALIVTAHPKLMEDLNIRNHFEAALQKLIAASPASIKMQTEQIRRKIHIDGAGWHASEELLPHLATVQEAVWGNRKLHMHYKRDQDTVVRIVHPLGLVAKRSVWYLVAEVETGAEREVRTYRISRIAHAEVLDEPFAYPEDFRLAEYWERSVAHFRRNLPQYPAEICISEPLLPRLEKELYITVIRQESEGNGRLRATVDFETLDHACRTVLSFGSNIEVVGPAELRDRVITELQSAIKLYGIPAPSVQDTETAFGARSGEDEAKLNPQSMQAP
jgi:predicted DNA-binding transcriptional regulator YafY